MFVPLGPKVTAALAFPAREGASERTRSRRLPHPSGANAKRIAFFLGRKPRERLSGKVAPDRFVATRAGAR